MKCPSLKHETHLLNNLGSKHTANEIWPVYVILQMKKFYQKNV